MIEELKSCRTENKYLISYDDAFSLYKKLDSVLSKDIHCQNKSYSVRSLYFDSIYNKDLNAKKNGLEHRKKIRIRLYNINDNYQKLELKEKNGIYQTKHSLKISTGQVKSLIAGDYGILREYFNTSETALKIYTIMMTGCYKPVALVEYDRIAYTHNINNTRITFDTNIRSSETYFDIFSKTPLYSNLYNDNVILEIKFNEQLLHFISKIFEPYNLNKTSISKYVMSRNLYHIIF